MENTNQNRPILLVDDNEAHRKLVKRAVAKAGFSNPVREAASLAQAQTLLAEQLSQSVAAPLVAIIDLNLSDGHGTLLIEMLKAEKHFSSVPCMVISTSALETDIRESYAKGASRFLVKNNDPLLFQQDLMEAMKALVNEPLPITSDTR
jgi:CheY-like chemotaxis protein